VFVNTVDSIINKYTVKEYSGTCKIQSLQDIIGRPSTKNYFIYIENNMLPICPITKSDILLAENILGPNLGLLETKTTSRTPSHVILNTCDELPEELDMEMSP